MKTTPLHLKYLNAAVEVHHLWFVMCEHDGIDPNSKFVVFSKDNPYQEEHRVAVEVLKTARKAYDLSRHRNTRARSSRAAERDMLSSLGMKKVRGALGGVYYE